MTSRSTTGAVLATTLACLAIAGVSAAQDEPPPTLRAAAVAGSVRIDGVLDEPEWA